MNHAKRLLPALAVFAWAASTASAARVDLLDFYPTEPGATYTLKGTTYTDGKNRPCTVTLKVISFDDFGKSITSISLMEMTIGSKKRSGLFEEEFDHRIRPIRGEYRHGREQQVHTYKAWAAAPPRFVEVGKTYRIDQRYEGPYGEVATVGTVHYAIETIPTALGAFECLCVVEVVEKTMVKTKAKRQSTSELWYARNFGLVQVRESVVHPDMMDSMDVTITASSQPLVFQPVVIATP